jgi:hypothetical protein
MSDSVSMPTAHVTGTATLRTDSSQARERPVIACLGAVAHKTTVAGCFRRIIDAPPRLRFDPGPSAAHP